MKVSKLRHVISFQQNKWLTPYININMQKKKESVSEFEKNFYKLMNNSVFGKTMKNIRKNMNVKLVDRVSKFRWLIGQPKFQIFQNFF